MTTEVRTKQWGNSIGLVIPKKIVEELKLKPGESILIDIGKKENPLKELFGSLKFKKSAEQLLKESREELNSKYI